MQCSVCGSSDFVTRGGFRSCNVCGVQIAEAEQRLEYDDAIAPSRVKATAKKVDTNNQVNELTSEAFTLIDSRVLLESYHFLLRAQVEALIVHSRCSVELLDLVGRLFANYINEWRSHGWAADDSQLIVYPAALGNQRLAEKHSWGQSETVRVPDAKYKTDAIDRADNRSDDTDDDDDDEADLEQNDPYHVDNHFIHNDSSVKHEPHNAMDMEVDESIDQSTTQSINQSSRNDNVLFKRKNKYRTRVLILRVGELSLTLSLAFLYIACLIAREPMSVQVLCSLARAGSLPYMSFLNGPSTRLPARLVQLIKCSYRLVSFYNPPLPPHPRKVFEHAALVAMKLGLHPKWYGRHDAPKLFLAQQSGYHLVRVDGVPTNTNAMVRSLMAQLCIPVELEPISMELLRLHTCIVKDVNRDKQDELSAAAAIFLSCHLVFGLDREPIDPMLSSVLSLIDDYTVDYLTKLQMRGWLMLKFRIKEHVARDKIRSFKQAIDKRVEAVLQLRDESDVQARADLTLKDTDWLPSEIRDVVEHFTQFRRVHGHTVDWNYPVWKKECDKMSYHWRKKPTLRALYKFQVHTIIDRRFWLESLAPVKPVSKPVAPAVAPVVAVAQNDVSTLPTEPSVDTAISQIDIPQDVAAPVAAVEHREIPQALQTVPSLPFVLPPTSFDKHCMQFVDSVKQSDYQYDMARRIDEEAMIRVPHLMNPSVVAANPKKLNAFLALWQEESIGPGLVEPSYEDIREYIRRAKDKWDESRNQRQDWHGDEKTADEYQYESIGANPYTPVSPLVEWWDALKSNMANKSFAHFLKVTDASLKQLDLSLPHDYMTLMLAICVVMGLTLEQFELYVRKFSSKVIAPFERDVFTRIRSKRKRKAKAENEFDENGVLKRQRPPLVVLGQKHAKYVPPSSSSSDSSDSSESSSSESSSDDENEHKAAENEMTENAVAENAVAENAMADNAMAD